jgi:hypothetical protein
MQTWMLIRSKRSARSACASAAATRTRAPVALWTMTFADEASELGPMVL